MLSFLRRDGRLHRALPGRRASYRESASFGALTFSLTTIVGLVSSIASSRIYGVNVIGEYALAVGTVAAVRLVSTAKERPALVRELATLEARNPRITGLWLATLTFSATLTCLVSAIAILVTRFLLTGPVARPGLFLPLALNVAGYALIGNTGENIDVVSVGFRAGRQLFWIRVTDGITFLAIAVPLGVVSGSIWGLIIASVGSQAIGLIHRFVRVRRFMRAEASREVIHDGFRTLPSLIRFGLKITPGALADGGANESGTWLVASFNSISAVGGYGRAYLLIKQVTSVVQYGTEMLFPTLIERRAKGDGEGHDRVLVDSIRYSAILLLLLAAALGGVTHGIMTIFGKGFDKGATPLLILFLMPALYMLSQIMRFALLSLNRPWQGTFAGFLRFGVTIAIGAVLTWQLGGTGAALGLVIGFIADLMFCSRIVLPQLETPFFELAPLRHWAVIFIAYGSGLAVSRLIYNIVPLAFGIVTGPIVGALAFLAVMFLGHAFNDRDRRRLGDVRTLVARRRGRSRPVAQPAVVEPALALALNSERVWDSARRASPGVLISSFDPTLSGDTGGPAWNPGARCASPAVTGDTPQNGSAGSAADVRNEAV